MRSAACSGASQTMVMREVSTRSDSPTVSETMLMLRRRNSEATRVRTPGLSETRATKVWSMSLSRFVYLAASKFDRFGNPEERLRRKISNPKSAAKYKVKNSRVDEGSV